MKQAAIAAATISKEKLCPICQGQFRRSHRANQFHRGGGRPHEDQIYCSDACRQKAYRRRAKANGAVTKDPPATRVQAAVTQPQNTAENIEEFRPKTKRVRPLFRNHDGEVVADAKWPGMYWIRWRDGRLSDIVNFTRAVDALRRASQCDARLAA